MLLIISLYYDPFTPALTDPQNTLSPLRLDPTACVAVQGACLKEYLYPIGARLFWASIVPASVFILLVFGHDCWRRICPLSFMSQLPAALGLQRRQKWNPSETGNRRHQPINIKKDAWLARNYLYFQFSLLYLGLCIRILFVNSDRWALGSFLLATIAAAIAVGFLYGGKSWCNYVCPMAPVQRVYGEPRGLLTRPAHQDKRPISQSMCRTVAPTGEERSACVACQAPCIDIDAERSYWETIDQPDRRLLYYGYPGLVFAFYAYYYLYAGNWDYYFLGAWTHEEHQLATLMHPGFYLMGTAIPIPKLVAVPLFLGLCTVGSYGLGVKLEKAYKAYARRHCQGLSTQIIRHRMFTLFTFGVFNLFFVFGGRPMLGLLPLSLQNVFNAMVVLTSTLWLHRTWGRSPELYLREKLAVYLRHQLSRLDINISKFLGGCTLEDLTPGEVYVLAKVLPGFTREKRRQVYIGVIREAMAEGRINFASSWEVLRNMRLQLEISDQEHQQLLTELGIENYQLFKPQPYRALTT